MSMNFHLSDETLVLSQDYELFFHKSGTIENCLLRPTEALAAFAKQKGLCITFYVDAGMLVSMRNYAGLSPQVSKMRDQVRRNLESLAADGHEIGLHVHPHWDSSRWSDGHWDFSNTRYSPKQFRKREFADICKAYYQELSEVAGTEIVTYRAGGFCVQPFKKVGEAIHALGINTDSSVVPGMYLNDHDKSFDFRKVPDAPWWSFDSEPTKPTSTGRFLEIPITAMRLPPFYYWGRAFDRLRRRQAATVYGDGLSKAIGPVSAARRLLALERNVEMSTDGPKAHRLGVAQRVGSTHRLHHVMGHPKLLSTQSLNYLQRFIDQNGISRFETVASLARKIREGLHF
jgi:hypothetical protein